MRFIKTNANGKARTIFYRVRLKSAAMQLFDLKSSKDIAKEMKVYEEEFLAARFYKKWCSNSTPLMSDCSRAFFNAAEIKIPPLLS